MELRMALEFLRLAVAEVQIAYEKEFGDWHRHAAPPEVSGGVSVHEPLPNLGPLTFPRDKSHFAYGPSLASETEVLTGHDILARVKSEKKPEGEVFRFTSDGFTAMDYGIDPDQEFQVLRRDDGGTWVMPL